MSRKPSEIWTHFNKKDNAAFVAVCKYCNQSFSYKSTTGNLNSHLKRSHASIYLARKTDSGNETTTVERNVSAPGTSQTSGSGTSGGGDGVASTSTAAAAPASVQVQGNQLIDLPRKRQRTMQNYIIKKMTPDEKKKVDRDLLDLFIAIPNC